VVEDWSLEAHFSQCVVLMMRKCLNCGDRQDAVTQLNKRRPQPTGILDQDLHKRKLTHRLQAVRLKKL
jgi:hypothetical protein